MDKDLEEQKKFLNEQFEWCRKEDLILAEIKKLLYEMKAIAEYASDHNLTTLETEELNGELEKIKSELHFLELELSSHGAM